MKTYLVTGNAGKLADFKRLLPSSFVFEAVAVDLPEIQTLDAVELVTDKVKRAYEELGKPVMVEDVTAGLNALQGLPGPFIKFFEHKLGMDALYQLVRDDAHATVISTIGYYDGTRLIITQGTVHGIAASARGTNGFGFDACFQPNGQSKTYGEMSPEEKDTISHRSISVAAFLKEFAQL